MPRGSPGVRKPHAPLGSGSPPGLTESVVMKSVGGRRRKHRVVTLSVPPDTEISLKSTPLHPPYMLAEGGERSEDEDDDDGNASLAGESRWLSRVTLHDHP